MSRLPFVTGMRVVKVNTLLSMHALVWDFHISQHLCLDPESKPLTKPFLFAPELLGRRRTVVETLQRTEIILTEAVFIKDFCH
jgi:hypothetical protein